MECSGKRYIATPSRSDVFKIWNLADLHLLSASCAEGELDRDIKKIKTDPFSFWVGGGDYADYIGYDDGKRFDPDCVSEKLTVRDLGRLGKTSVQAVYEKLSPIKDKCLGLLFGNHEKHYQRHQKQAELHGWLCTEMGVPNLGYSCLFDLVFKRTKEDKPRRLATTLPSIHTETFRVFCHHGSGFAVTPGGKLNRLIRFMDAFDADIYFVGHVHDKMGRRQTRIGADAKCGTLVQKVCLGIISGGYLKTYEQETTSYGEQRGYSPTTLGAAWVTIEPNTRTLRAEI